MNELYDALGISPDATAEEVRKAYRKAAKKAHPDAGGSKEKFAIVSLAHDVLSDQERRANYDRTGSTDDKAQDKSLACVLQVIDEVLSECTRRGIDPSTVDVISDAKKTVRLKIEKMDEQARQAKEQIKKARATAKRFKAKKGKQDRIGPLLESRIRQAEGDAAKMTADKPSLQKALDILNDHDFDWTASDQGYGRSGTTMDFATLMRHAATF